MNINFNTLVNASFDTVIKNFDINLFKALKPPLTPLKILRFDGSQTGDEVHIDLGFGQKWISKITDHGTTDNEWYFIDEGKLLPSPIKTWTHLHRVVAIHDNKTLIEDNITFHTKNAMLDLLIYPPLYLQFLWRVPAYKKFFKNLTPTIPA